MPATEIFIGREKISERLRRDVFRVSNGSYGHCYSLIGPNGIGKTRLIRHLSEELEREPIPNTYYFSTTIEDGMTFWDYWSALILRFADDIPEEKLEAAPHYVKRFAQKICNAYKFFDENLGSVHDMDFKQRAVLYLNDLFAYYTKLGIRIIITIDEFDRAQKVFEDGQFFQRLFGLTSKGAARLNLSIITISRRSVSTIAHHMQEGSNFQDAYPPLTLKGFFNEELEEYFQSYSSLPCGIPSEEERQQILFLCGRSPGLLMRMRHEIELLGDGKMDIAEIYTEHGGFIKTAFERMCTLMKNEYVDHAKTVSGMSIFIQCFVGPVYTERIGEKIERLYDYGFITKSTKKEDIFALSGMRAPSEEEDMIYEPISPYFIDYLKHAVIPDEITSLSGMLEKAERAVRRVLASALMEAYPDTWEDVISGDVPKKEEYLSHLRLVALQNDAGLRNLTISKLNVLAFHDYYQIIQKHWDIMEKYFSVYSSKAELKVSMSLLNDFRNSSAHLNLEILNEQSRRSLSSECQRLIQSIELGENVGRQPVETAPEDGKTEEQNEKQKLINKVVNVVQMETTSRGGVRGMIEGTVWGIALSPAYLKGKGIRAKDLCGKPVKVKVLRWDDNAQKFNGEMASE